MAPLTSRVLYHAPGDGLGHLVRAGRFLRTYFPTSYIIVTSNSRYLFDPRLTELLAPQTSKVLLPSTPFSPRQAWQALLQSCLDEGLTHLCIDAFPLGLHGELMGLHIPETVSVWQLCRRLKWSDYRTQLGDPLTGPLPFPSSCRTVLLEPLETAHLAFLGRIDRGVHSAFPPAHHAPTPAPATDPTLIAGLLEALAALPQPPWLIIHSGSREELEALVGYAHDLRTLEGHEGPLWLVTPEPLTEPLALSPPVHALSLWPVDALFAPAHRIVTACGYNLMEELRPWRHKHHFMPLPRRFDDQHWRARWHRTEPPV